MMHNTTEVESLYLYHGPIFLYVIQICAQDYFKIHQAVYSSMHWPVFHIFTRIMNQIALETKFR